MSESDNSTFDRAHDGTAYWTLSLYVAAESLAKFYTAELVGDPGAALRAAQLRHKPSFALRSAIDPLFNDIADRDFFGRPRDFLFAAGLGNDNLGEPWTLESAAAAVRTETELDFEVPAQFSWVTEGIRFHCDLKDDLVRKIRLRRSWFAHSDGALSYHLSFEHRYGKKPPAEPSTEPRDILHDPYGMQTYYFLSLLQKLAAPKEFMLGEAQLEALTGSDGDGAYLNPFLSDAPTGIDPLDKIKVRTADGSSSSFWRFVRDKFVGDARILLDEVFHVAAELPDAELEALPGMTEVIEVPGLMLPRCRYLFHINDERFFNRLLPVDPLTKEGLARKRVVREQCFVPFRDMINNASRSEDGTDRQAVWLGADNDLGANLPWPKFDLTETYEEWIKIGVFLDPDNKIGDEYQPYPDEAALKRGLHAGTALICYDAKDQPIDPPVEVFIPAYETGRADCVDYLFLSGFNQNIIDWLNQDTSEILDSIDPIYPTEDLQADERFFVRYANHRGMITYVAGSRSLEMGNDYLGTCPYAFLIHVLAMHNEFLARDHEQSSDRVIEFIDAKIQLLHTAQGTSDQDEEAPVRLGSRQIEHVINELKRNSYRKYERHRYLNIFRYDTEAIVFKRLSELRGTDWRGQAMERALATLEEYATDLDRHQTEAEADKRREQGERLGALVGAVGLISGVGVLFDLAEYFEKNALQWPLSGPAAGGNWFSFISGNLAWLIAVLSWTALLFLVVVRRVDIWRALAKTLRSSRDQSR